MTDSKGFRHLKESFFKPRVFAFILIGVGFMLLTFFTHDNALELGISGIASIFIGIGVNNFTAIETEQKDNERLNRKTQLAIKTLVHIQDKLKKIKIQDDSSREFINLELDEMNDYIDLCVQYLQEV